MLPLALSALAYTVTIVGAQGRLGRELAVQSLQRGWDVRGVVRRPHDPLLLPSRRGWLTEDRELDGVPLLSDRLTLTRNTSCPTDAVVFAMSARPFASEAEMRVQTEVVRRMCRTPCRKICLVSAHGAGDSLPGSNVGIQIMHDFYLKEGYAAKEEQEDLVSRVDGAETLILRPRVLSFQKIPLNPWAVVRSELAAQILDWLE